MIKHWFGKELRSAGARTEGLSWGDDGLTFNDTPTPWTQAEKDAVNAVLAAHDPNTSPGWDLDENTTKLLKAVCIYFGQQVGKTPAQVKAGIKAAYELLP